MPRRIEKIREAGVNELEAQQKELTEQIFRLRFQLTTGQAEALKRLRESRKDLARVKTLLRANELQAQAKPAQAKPAQAKPVQAKAVQSKPVKAKSKPAAARKA
jgi:large subunit ribosomal protein L29